jgi:hypothetical protein
MAGDLDAIFERLREEVRTGAPRPSGGAAPAEPVVLLAREEAERWSAVTAERPYLYKPGSAGRIRGLVLLPIKAVLRRMMKWYVEPFAFDQRHFNGAALRLVDEILAANRAEIARLEARIAELERERASAQA